MTTRTRCKRIRPPDIGLKHEDDEVNTASRRRRAPHPNTRPRALDKHPNACRTMSVASALVPRHVTRVGIQTHAFRTRSSRSTRSLARGNERTIRGKSSRSVASTNGGASNWGETTSDVTSNESSGDDTASSGRSVEAEASTRDGDGGDGGGGGDGLGRGGGGGDDGGDDGDGQLSEDEARAWAEVAPEEAKNAADGGALFGTLVLTVLGAPIAYIVFDAIKPSAAEREEYEYQTRDEAWRRRQQEKLAKEEAEVAKAREQAAKLIPHASDAVAVKHAEKHAVRLPEQETAKQQPVVRQEEREVDAESSATSVADSAHEQDADGAENDARDAVTSSEEEVRVVSVSERSGAPSASEIDSHESQEQKVSEDEDPRPLRPQHTAPELDDAQLRMLDKHHHKDEEYMPSHPDVTTPHYKLVLAVKEANALVHQAHARRTEANQEFEEALRYRKQVVHIAAEKGIPVAPLRDVKETFSQSEKPPLDVVARKKAEEALEATVEATKKFVTFASPHVRTASVKAFDFGKHHAVKATETLKAARDRGDVRVPTPEEVTDFAKSSTRRILGVAVGAFDRIKDAITEHAPARAPSSRAQ